VNNRDTLAKAIYDKVFDKIVYQVNKSLFVHREPGWNIGVLDIFGFEVFEVNSFEQLCINYCNEKLQTFFNDVIFDSELKYYRSEDVSVDDITYKDNNPCVALIDAKAGGIFSQVADIAINKSATDDDLCKKLVETFLEKAATKCEYFARTKKRGTFAVKHFAGDVTYTVDGFIEKKQGQIARCSCIRHGALFSPLA
jgi:myosin-7